VILLVLGVLLWSAAHLFPCVARPARAQLIERLGEGPYKGLFALAIVGSIVLMVFGWRATDPSPVYVAPAWTALVANVLMFVALVLFAASGVPTNVKRILRHPQLTAVATWSVAHLISNGDTRSLVLFGGIGLWAVVSMVAINRRDGAWEKPDPLPMSAELKPLVGALVVFVVLFLVHPWIAGVSPMPR
jgi:uncharacterized membrane protein